MEPSARMSQVNLRTMCNTEEHTPKPESFVGKFSAPLKGLA